MRPGGNLYHPGTGALKRQVNSCLSARHIVSFVILPTAFHIPVEARTALSWKARMCAKAVGFCGSG